MGDKVIKCWFPKIIKGKKLQRFADWINCWADFDKHRDRTVDDKYTIGKDKIPNHITEYGEGYNKAIGDVFRYLGFDYRSIKKKRSASFK